MDKNKFLLFPLITGIMLIAYSWFLSYPLSIDSSGDFVFNHISVLYWFGLALTLPSMYMIAVTSKRNSVKWIMTVSIVMTMYSLSYFYYMLPGSDSQNIRGLTEFFIKTKNLDSSQPSHSYFQWPSFFIFANTMTSVTGLGEATNEFLVYALIGFLMATVLYVYASKASKNGGFLAVIAFFVVMLNILNYQFVPFSLAFGLLLLLFILGSRPWSSGLLVTVLVLFLGITLMHAFVPIFFILYLLIQYIVSRNQQYGKLCLLTSIIYVAVEFAMAPIGFASSILSTMTRASEYSQVITIKPASTVPVDAIAQMFSRAVPVVFGVICLAGFIALLVKRKLRRLDGALLACGIIYSSLGVVLYTLGSRAIPLAFIPISLGTAYLFESRFRAYLKYVFLVLLILFTFISIHQSFGNEIQFQTKEAYTAENFTIDHYNWTKTSFILAQFRVIPYFQSKLSVNPSFSELYYKEADTIFYTVGLGKDFSGENSTLERLFQEERLNMVYNDGFSYLAIKAQP